MRRRCLRSSEFDRITCVIALPIRPQFIPAAVCTAPLLRTHLGDRLGTTRGVRKRADRLLAQVAKPSLRKQRCQNRLAADLDVPRPQANAS